MPPCLAISQGSWGSNRGLHAYRRACYRLPLLPFFTAVAGVTSGTQYPPQQEASSFSPCFTNWNTSNPRTHDASGLFTVVTRLLASYYQQFFTGKVKMGKKAGPTA